MNLILPWVSGNSHYPSTEKRQIPSGVLLVLSPVSTSRQRCANNLQCFSSCPRVVQQCDSNGAPGTISEYTGTHTVPRPSRRRGRVCTFLRNTESISLFPSPIPLFLSDILCPVPHPSIPLIGKDGTMEQIVC